MRLFLSALSLLVLVSATRKTVSFADTADIRDGDQRSTGHRSHSPPAPRKSSKGDFDSEDDEDDPFKESAEKSGRPYGRSERTETGHATSRTPVRQPESPSRSALPTVDVTQRKNRSMLDTASIIVDTILDALRGGYHNEFIAADEVAAYEARNGPVTVRRDPAEMALRISRPATWLAANMWAFYDFPFGAPYWGLALIINMLGIVGWRQYDSDWMIVEMGHWDYALGLGLFVGMGIISMLHQGIQFLSEIFFALAPVLILTAYIAALSYAAFRKPHQYY